MEVHVLPLPVPAVPHARLLRLHGPGPPATVRVLGEPDVGDAGRVLAQQVHVRVQEDGVDGLAALGQSCGEGRALSPRQTQPGPSGDPRANAPHSSLTERTLPAEGPVLCAGKRESRGWASTAPLGPSQAVLLGKGGRWGERRHVCLSVMEVVTDRHRQGRPVFTVMGPGALCVW